MAAVAMHEVEYNLQLFDSFKKEWHRKYIVSTVELSRKFSGVFFLSRYYDILQPEEAGKDSWCYKL